MNITVADRLAANKDDDDEDNSKDEDGSAAPSRKRQRTTKKSKGGKTLKKQAFWYRVETHIQGLMDKLGSDLGSPQWAE